MTPIQMTIGLAMWLGVALFPIAFELTNVRLAFGLMGTPGTANVTSCTDDQQQDYCSGRFTPESPSSAPVDVTLRADSKVGDTFPAQLHPNGDRA
ncbi:hypothetical protein ACFQ07_02130, partial [Actinomadura adrarensis]